MINRIFTFRGSQFSDVEVTALQAMRMRYHTDQGLFTDREMARLRFVRWLVQSRGWNRALDQPYPSVDA